MKFDVSGIDHNLDLLQELLDCVDGITCWSYDASGQLLDTDSPELVYNTVFESSGCKAYMMDYGQGHTAPIILTAPPGLMWGAVFEYKDGTLHRAHLIGPVMSSDVSLTYIEEVLRKTDIPLNWKSTFIRKLQQLPVISSINFFPYMLMLHYCVTGQKLGKSDIQYQQNAERHIGLKDPAPKKDRHQTWMAEQALLRMVREGDLNYKQALNHAASVSNGVRVTLGDPLMQAKLSAVSFIVLCVRAAIDGGLSPELAYSRGDAYTQSLMECKTVSEAGVINHTMYEDFITAVHKCRTNPDVSKQVQSCCDYIELHTEEKFTIESLARRVGYTEYYLSRKFKVEMKVSINDYIKYAKVERAKMLLTTSTESIQEISDKLNFCSRSYFSEVFRSVTGISPVDFRAKNQRL